jgi:glycosyltransferase involved in cell wall biosynthesis
MKIGVMLRHLRQRGGINVYTKSILRALLEIDRKNKYIFMYRHAEQMGTFAEFANVKEMLVRSPNNIWWDQIAVARVAKKENMDLIYNPKLSIPIMASCKTIFVMHGAEQFAVPHAFRWYDRIYTAVAMRMYFKSASAVIMMTHQGVKDIVKFIGADPRKIHIIYESCSEHCRPLEEEALNSIRKKYDLPEHFILFLGGINPIKNFGNVLRAYQVVQREYPHKLVVVGFLRWKYSKDFKLIDQLGLRKKIIFTGFIPDEDIPAFYNLAEVLVFPSLYEGFGMPVLEAMSCECPVVTSKTGCSPEVAGDAAVLVDPYDKNDIIRGIKKVLDDSYLREQMIWRGVQRSREFGWKKCAKQTLDLFESLAMNRT